MRILLSSSLKAPSAGNHQSTPSIKDIMWDITLLILHCADNKLTKLHYYSNHLLLLLFTLIIPIFRTQIFWDPDQYYQY